MALGESYRKAAAGAALIVVLIAPLALAGCGDKTKAGKDDAAKTETAAGLIEAAADPCTGASTAFTQALCGDPDLQGLVGQVKTNLVQAAADVPMDSAREIAEGQTQWLESTRIACGIGETKVPLTPEQENCVSGALKQRAERAAQTVTQRGGFTFQAVELNRAAPVVETAGADGFGPVAIEQNIRFPRIQGDTPPIRRFNELMAQRPQYALSDQTSEYVDYTIAFAGPELISVRFTTSENSAGAAHPSNGEKVITVVMSTGEPLKETDVFAAPEARWKAFIVQRVTRDLRRQFNAMAPSIELRAAEVADTATKTKNWLVTENELVVLFPPESIGPHALGNFEVKIPWADMKALLNPQAPAPIRRT